MKIPNSRGYTLIELMVATTIIGLLTLIAVPRFVSLVDKTKESTVKAALGTLRSAISIYYSDNDGLMPVTLTEGLTTSQKYLNSLPTIKIPPTKNGNPGHDANSGEALGSVADESIPGIWMYAGPGTGNLRAFINCTHQDQNGTQWNSY